MKKAIDSITSAVGVVTTFAPFLAALVAGLTAFTDSWNANKPTLK